MSANGNSTNNKSTNTNSKSTKLKIQSSSTNSGAERHDNRHDSYKSAASTVTKASQSQESNSNTKSTKNTITKKVTDVDVIEPQSGDPSTLNNAIRNARKRSFTEPPNLEQSLVITNTLKNSQQQQSINTTTPVNNGTLPNGNSGSKIVNAKNTGNANTAQTVTVLNGPVTNSIKSSQQSQTQSQKNVGKSKSSPGKMNQKGNTKKNGNKDDDLSDSDLSDNYSDILTESDEAFLNNKNNKKSQSGTKDNKAKTSNSTNAKVTVQRKVNKSLTLPNSGTGSVVVEANATEVILDRATHMNLLKKLNSDMKKVLKREDSKISTTSHSVMEADFEKIYQNQIRDVLSNTYLKQMIEMQDIKETLSDDELQKEQKKSSKKNKESRKSHKPGPQSADMGQSESDDNSNKSDKSGPSESEESFDIERHRSRGRLGMKFSEIVRKAEEDAIAQYQAQLAEKNKQKEMLQQQLQQTLTSSSSSNNLNLNSMSSTLNQNSNQKTGPSLLKLPGTNYSFPKLSSLLNAPPNSNTGSAISSGANSNVLSTKTNSKENPGGPGSTSERTSGTNTVTASGANLIGGPISNSTSTESITTRFSNTFLKPFLPVTRIKRMLGSGSGPVPSNRSTPPSQSGVGSRANSTGPDSGNSTEVETYQNENEIITQTEPVTAIKRVRSALENLRGSLPLIGGKNNNVSSSSNFNKYTVTTNNKQQQSSNTNSQRLDIASKVREDLSQRFVDVNSDSQAEIESDIDSNKSSINSGTNQKKSSGTNANGQQQTLDIKSLKRPSILKTSKDRQNSGNEQRLEINSVVGLRKNLLGPDSNNIDSDVDSYKSVPGTSPQNSALSLENTNQSYKGQSNSNMSSTGSDVELTQEQFLTIKRNSRIEMTSESNLTNQKQNQNKNLTVTDIEIQAAGGGSSKNSEANYSNGGESIGMYV